MAILKEQAKRDIISRKERFIKYAKAYGESVREEREFRKSIFRG